MEFFRQNKKNEKSALENVEDLKPDEIAFLHNECLHFIFSKCPSEFNETISSDNLIYEVELFSDFLIERLPEARSAILNVKENTIIKLNECGDNAKNKSFFVLSVFSVDKFKKELQKGKFSIRFIDDICLFLEYIMNGNEGIEKAFEQWNTMLETDYETFDNYALSCMNAIGSASLDLWGKHKMVSKIAGSCPPNGLTCNEWQAICDGLGGVIGTIFGGIGSALTGALFSFAVARECVDCDTLQPA